MKSRIGELIYLLLIAQKKGAKLNGKSAFEKELTVLLGQPHIFGKPTSAC